MKKWMYHLRAVLSTLRSTVANHTTRYLGHGPGGKFIMPVLLGIASWALIYVIATTTTGLQIRYSVDWPVNAQLGECRGSGKQGIGRKVVVSLHNLSSDKVTKATFSLSSRDENAGVFSYASIWAKSPASEGRSFAEITHEREVDFTIRGFHPGYEFKLQACYSGNDEPKFRLMKSEESVVLLSGAKASLVEHRVSIIAIIAMLCLLLIIIGWRARAQVTDKT